MKNILTVMFCLILASCLSEDSTQNSSDDDRELQESISLGVFSDDVTSFNIQVFYEIGAEPYVGSLNLSGDSIWDITSESYEALFSNHLRSVSVPSNLIQMEEIVDQNKATWTFAELKSLGDSLAPELIENNNANVAVIFLNGTYDGNNSILGIHLGGTYYSFVFKDVVISVGGGAKSQAYVEQATVVHEIGHSIGFVNNGVPMVSAHEDLDHPKHTTNSDGVMYWAVESPNEILSLLGDLILQDKLSLFGEESLEDGRSYHP